MFLYLSYKVFTSKLCLITAFPREESGAYVHRAPGRSLTQLPLQEDFL